MKPLSVIPKDYLTYLAEQIAWHDHKATISKRIYRCATIISIAFSAFISFLAVIRSTFTNTEPFVTIATAALATVITIAGSYILSSKDAELRVTYRTTCESLKMELANFQSKNDPYNSKEKAINLNQLSKNCDAILANTMNQWKNTIVEVARH